MPLGRPCYSAIGARWEVTEHGWRDPGRDRFTLELWDFGLPVEIEIRDADPPEHIGVREVAEIAIDLWRRRRAYRRQ